MTIADLCAFPISGGDGDGWLVNYVGHPGHGAAAGFIWAQNDPGSPAHEAGFSGGYSGRAGKA